MENANINAVFLTFTLTFIFFIFTVYADRYFMLSLVNFISFVIYTYIYIHPFQYFRPATNSKKVGMVQFRANNEAQKLNNDVISNR